MYKKTILKPFLFLITSVLTAQVNAASIGTYTFEDNAIADQLVSAQGQMYDGSNWLYASNTNWSTFNGLGWVESSTPNDATDVSVSTYLAATQSSGRVSLELDFSQTSAVNGAGDDLAFFFLWDQSSNAANVSINGISQQLTFSDIFNDVGVQQVANNVIWNGTTNDNVALVAASIDLGNFGLSSGEILNSSVMLLLESNSDTAMALSMTTALNSTVVPVPAAVWLFGSGLLALAGIARRRV